MPSDTRRRRWLFSSSVTDESQNNRRFVEHAPPDSGPIMSSNIALISDVHGNDVALEACLRDMKSFRVEGIYNLGDVFGYGPNPDRCLEVLLNVCAGSVLGNHDHYIASSTDCPRSRSANIALEIQRSRVSQSSLEALRALPVALDLEHPRLSMRHGGWNDALEEYVAPTDEYFSLMPAGFYFSGHTHVPCVRDFGSVLYCNPGSVGQPRDGDWRASYALVDLIRRKVLIRRVIYAVDEVAEAMRRQGFPRWNYRNLAIGTRI